VFGPLTIQERVDVAGAIGAWTTAKSNGASTSLEQFVPNWDRKPQQQPVEQMIAVMRAIQARGKRGKQTQ